MKITMKHGTWPEAAVAFFAILVYLAAVVAWILGIAVAEGFWMTLGAVCIPPMAWVLLAQWALGV
jgi:uncharacterized membrane protein